MSTVTSYCRFCHSCCPILVDVDDRVATKVRGDPANELYHGYTCIKGRDLPAQHRHPDRLLHSRKRQPDGSYVPIPVQDAMDEIAAKLQQILADHGPSPSPTTAAPTVRSTRPRARCRSRS